MKLAEHAVGHYLEGSIQLQIPSYQRPYAWSDDRLVDLWRDVAHQYRSRVKKTEVKDHFMGAMILERLDEPESGMSAVAVIDGQQRLLTLLVLLAALRDQIAHTKETKVPVQNPLFRIKAKHGSRRFPRVIVKPHDQPVMDAILRGDFVAEIQEPHFDTALAHAYRFFRYQLWTGKQSVLQHALSFPPRPARGKSAPLRGSYSPWLRPAKGRNAIDLPRLDTVVTSGLRLLELRLEQTDEESGVIFETMNAKSTPLSQFDLLRNSIFVRMPRGKEQFHETVWQHVEATLSVVSYSSLRDKPQEQFLYEYVIASGEAGVSKDTMHRRWLTRVIDKLGYAVTPASERVLLADFVTPLYRSAFLYPLAVGQRKSVTIQPSGTEAVTDGQHGAIREIMAMSGGPAVPLILRALYDHHHGPLTSAGLDSILADLQSYLVRLVLAGEDFSPLRATFMSVASKVDIPITPASLRKALKQGDWKTDAEILSAVNEVDLKKWKSAVIFPILRGIEAIRSGAGAHPMVFGNKANQFSIEHVYPQTENIGPAWTSDLLAWGASRGDIDARRYALGNLTAVTNYDNRRNGKKQFVAKRTLIAASAPLKLHGTIVSAARWTPSIIDRRTTSLAKAALKRWPRN